MVEHIANKISIYKKLFSRHLSIPEKDLQIVRAGSDNHFTDSCLAYIAILNQSEPCGVLIQSPPNYPLAAKESGIKATECAMELPPSLGNHIMTPFEISEIQGSSYGLYDYCFPLPEKGISFRYYRYFFSQSTINWVHRIAKESVTEATQSERKELFLDSLSELGSNQNLPHEIRAACQQGIETLQVNHQTKVVMSHGDLWIGNIHLHQETQKNFFSYFTRSKFKVIDWATANVRGFPVFDLVKLLDSWRVSKRLSRRELIRYSETINCKKEDLVYYTLAALGHIQKDLGHFPPEKHVRLTKALWKRVKEFC